MDEDFENLSASSSDEWAILDDNPASNIVIIDDNVMTEKFCSICGSELDQIIYKNTYCKICPVCYACHQKYQGHPSLLRCQGHDRPIASMHESYEVHSGNNDCSQSEPIVLDYQSMSDFYDLSQSACKENIDVDTENYAQNSRSETTTEKEFPVLPRVQQGLLDVVHAASRPLQIPTIPMRRSIESITDCSSHNRYSLSSSDGEAITSASTSPDRSSTTAAAAPSLVSTSDLATRLATAFEFAPAVCCAPRPVPTLASRLSGSPPGIISGMAVAVSSAASCSPPPSPPSVCSSRSSLVASGSPINSAAQFLKSVVMHSATALNNFDLLPMHPWEDSQKPQSAGVPPASLARDGAPATGSATAVAADCWLPTSPHVWEEEQFRALIAPKPLPKSVYEASTYNFL